MSKSMGLTDVLERVHSQTGGEDLTVADVVEALENRGFGPLLLGASLLTVLPTGAIPGVPTVTAVLVVLIAVQMIAGRSRPWLPRRVETRSIKQRKFELALEKVKPYTRKFDALLKSRLTWMTGPIAIRVVAGCCVGLAVSMPPLEVVPFASGPPAFAIAMMAVGISAEDGLVVAIGLATAVVGLAATGYFLL